MAESPCPHHWLIDAPAGATSTGTCRRCGAVRVYRNSFPELEQVAHHTLQPRNRDQEPTPVNEIPLDLWHARWQR